MVHSDRGVQYASRDFRKLLKENGFIQSMSRKGNCWDILQSGIIVNNAILLSHFAQEKMAEGLAKREAMLQSIAIRTRPVLMTAFAVAAGMLPVSLGSAIGLERLAPLGAVAIGGLLVGTFLTLVFIPLIFIWTTSEKNLEPATVE